MIRETRVVRTSIGGQITLERVAVGTRIAGEVIMIDGDEDPGTAVEEGMTTDDKKEADPERRHWRCSKKRRRKERKR